MIALALLLAYAAAVLWLAYEFVTAPTDPSPEPSRLDLLDGVGRRR